MANKTQTADNVPPRTFPIVLSLTEAEIRDLAASVPEAPPSTDRISFLANTVLRQLAAGGLLIDAATMRRLIEIAERDIDSPADLVPLVEKASGKREGKCSFEIAIDPVYVGCLKEKAALQGRTLAEVVRGICNQILANGWLYSVEPEPRTFRISREDEAALEQILGKRDLTGEDLVEFIRSESALPLGGR